MIDYTDRTRNICIFHRIDNDSDRFFEYSHIERCVDRETAEYLAGNNYADLDSEERKKYRRLIEPFVEHIAMEDYPDEHIVVRSVVICERCRRESRYSFEGDGEVFPIEEEWETVNDWGQN